ncbi:MAG: hypothetical protein QM669_08420 [Siphonobacter sp.]
MSDTLAFYQQFFANDQLFLIPSEQKPLTAKEPNIVVEIAKKEPEIEAEGVRIQQVPAIPESSPVQLTYAPPRLLHQVLILTDNPTEADLILLENILKAVGHTLQTIDLLDINKLMGQNLNSILREKSVHHVITFGVPLKKIGLQIFLMPYQIRSVDQMNFLMVDYLSALHDDKAKKKALWIELKKLFAV